MGIEKIISIEDVTPKTGFPFVFDIQVSGGETFVVNGIVVHNSDVNYGHEDRPITGNQTIHVRAYKRKNKDGTETTVAAHDVTYVNKRVIRFRPKLSKFERGDPIYRVISKDKAREGQFFLERGLLKEIVRLPEDVGFYLKRLETTGTI